MEVRFNDEAGNDDDNESLKKYYSASVGDKNKDCSIF